MDLAKPFSATCEVCGNPSLFHLCLAEGRKWTQEHDFCQSHVDETFARHFRHGRVGLYPEPELEATTRFDIEMLVVRKGNWESLCYLREVGGTRRFWSTIGFCDGFALYWLVQHSFNNRPGTHAVFANTIAVLGGTLQEVVIDGHTESEPWFNAFLHIQQAGQTLKVSVRPSDAINLAIFCDVQIWVSKEAFAKLPRTPQRTK